MIRKVVVLLVLLTGVFFVNEAFPQEKKFSGIDIFSLEGKYKRPYFYRYRFSRWSDQMNPERIKLVDQTEFLSWPTRKFYLLREDSSEVVYTSQSRHWWMGFDRDTICIVRNKMASILRTTIAGYDRHSVTIKTLIQLEKITPDSIILSEYVLYEVCAQPTPIQWSYSDLGKRFDRPLDSLNTFIRYSITRDSKDVILTCTVLESKNEPHFIKPYSTSNFAAIDPVRVVRKPFSRYLVSRILNYRLYYFY